MRIQKPRTNDHPLLLSLWALLDCQDGQSYYLPEVQITVLEQASEGKEMRVYCAFCGNPLYQNPKRMTKNAHGFCNREHYLSWRKLSVPAEKEQVRAYVIGWGGRT